MKRFISLLLVFVLIVLALSGCDRRSTEPDADAGDSGAETGGLTQAVEEQAATEPPAETSEPLTVPEPVENSDGTPGSEQAVAQDQPIAPEAGDGTVQVGQDAGPMEISPFSSPTPQPNASVSQYSEIVAQGLGFRFSYPTGWVNIPGRSTVCYVQPLENGTVYPARVAVTMKRVLFPVDAEVLQDELVSYLRTLMNQYGNDAFKVDKTLDTETKFMGKNGLAATYLAYDGDQGIKGYVIATHFERYIFVFHFLCAYDDYTSFEPTLRYMRDSVQPDDEAAPK